MKRLLVLVEGQTEETFVRDVLTPHLNPMTIHPTPVILKTKRVKAGGHFRGGVTSTDQVLADARRLLNDTRASAVTTILDYYGLPSDFPGMAQRPPGDAYERVDCVERAFLAAINVPSFIPHLVLHEYEAWIFADPECCDWVFDDSSVAENLTAIAHGAGGPERINEFPQSAPSKRLVQEFSGYKKTLHGPMAVGAIGLARVREKCPHFDAWLRRVEGL